MDKVSKPILGELQESKIDDILEVMPNPDLILKKAGKANEIYAEMMYDSDVFSAYQKRKKSIQKLNYKIEGKDKRAIELIEITLKDIDFTKLSSGLLKALAFGYAVSEIIWALKDGKYIVESIKARASSKFSFNANGELLYKSEDDWKLAPPFKFITDVTIS